MGKQSVRAVEVAAGRWLAPAPEVTVVVPLHDEAATLDELAERVARTLDGLDGLAWELILVDDASRDASPRVLARLRAADPRVRTLHLPTRSGQSAALDAGFRAARGEWIATLDADLQNPPEELAALLAARDGVEIVHGRRRIRHDDLRRRIASRVGNAVRNALTGHHLRDACCSLRLMRREALQLVPRFDGAHRFLPTLFAAQGLATREIDVDHAPRRTGRSKYGVWDRALGGLVDCLAVRWYCRRALRTTAVESDGDERP